MGYIAVAAAGYLLVGLLLVVFGPFRERIIRDVRDTKFDARRQPDLGKNRGTKQGAITWKIALFTAILAFIAILAWPFLLRSAMQNNATSRIADSIMAESDWEMERPGLWFESMSGTGELSCSKCRGTWRLVSSIHGRDHDGMFTYQSGFQCQACRSFATVHSRRESKDLRCACNGELSRDKQILCPNCGDENVTYRCLVMT